MQILSVYIYAEVLLYPSYHSKKCFNRMIQNGYTSNMLKEHLGKKQLRSGQEEVHC